MDEKKGLLMASSGAMEKQGIGAVTEKQQQQQQILPVLQLAQKCPRCDSTNTKFCYYNNYSLSQPRHFCKACKRYWTRGGTLRNVPVGGGCRKNKRLKIIRTPPPPPVTSTTVIARDLPIASNPMMLSGNYTASRVVDHLFPEEAPGLGFSSSAGQLLFNGHDFLHNYSSSSASCQTAMNSLLASTIEHQKFISGGNEQLKDDSSAMNKVQGQINYNYPVGYWNNYLGYQMEDQHVIGLSSSTTADPNYYWSLSNNANTSNNWHDPPAANTHESPLPSFI